jgi:hypothetical protein
LEGSSGGDLGEQVGFSRRSGGGESGSIRNSSGGGSLHAINASGDLAFEGLVNAIQGNIIYDFKVVGNVDLVVQNVEELESSLLTRFKLSRKTLSQILDSNALSDILDGVERLSCHQDRQFIIGDMANRSTRDMKSDVVVTREEAHCTER